MIAKTPTGNLDLRVGFAIALSLLFWASAFAGIKAGLQAYHPGELALFRYLVASGVFLIVIPFSKLPLPAIKDGPILLLLGLLGVTGYHLALSYGQLSVKAGSASMLIATAPIFASLLAVIFLGEHLRSWGWLGIGLSFIGSCLIALGEGQGLQLEPGVLLILAAALFVSGYLVIQKPLLQRYSPLQITACTAWFGTLGMLLFLPSLLTRIVQTPLSATLPVIYLGLCPTAIAYTTWSYVLSRIPVSQTASFLFLTPPLATVVAWIWVGEIPSLLSVLGGSLALLGVFMVNRWGRA